MFIKSAFTIFFVFFYGCSFLTTFDQSKAVENKNSYVRAETSATPKPAQNALPVEAKVENATIKLEACRLTFTADGKTETFDFAFSGICGFEKNPDDETAPRIVETPNGRVLNVIALEKTDKVNSSDKHSQPCNTKMRWIIIKNGEIFLSEKTAARKNNCVVQLDEKDYFIFSKNAVTLKQAESEKAESN